MAADSAGPRGKDDEGRELLQVAAVLEEARSRALGMDGARSSRCRRAAGVLAMSLGLVAAAVLAAVALRPVPWGSSGARGSSSHRPAGTAEDAVGLEGLGGLPGWAEGLVKSQREADRGCDFYSRRRRARSCTACASGPKPDPGCERMELHTDGILFNFSVEVTLRDLPEEGVEIIKSANGAFRFGVHGSARKRGLVSFEFKPINKPLTIEQAEAREAEMKARGEAWEEMTSTPMPKETRDIHGPNFYFGATGAYGIKARRLEGHGERTEGGVFDTEHRYTEAMYQVYSVKPLDLHTTWVVTVKKNQKALCLSVIPKTSHWKAWEACTQARFAETDAYTLYQMLPPGELYWSEAAKHGLAAKPVIEARNFKLLDNSLPFSYTVIGLPYPGLVQEHELEEFRMAMKEGISVDTGVPLDHIHMSMSAGTLKLHKPKEVHWMKEIFGSERQDPAHIGVSVTLERLGNRSYAVEDALRDSTHLLISIAVRVGQVINEQGHGKVLVANLQAPPRELTSCANYKCPSLSRPDHTRSCMGGDCKEICCIVDATCAEYKGCHAPYHKKSYGLFRRCWGEKQCAEVCCERSCWKFECPKYWAKKREKHETYCNHRPKWSLKCNGTAHGSDANCAAQCCYKVEPPCCTDKNVAFCRACQTCDSRNVAFCRACQTCDSRGHVCKEAGLALKAARHLEDLQNATRSSLSGDVPKAKNLLQSATKAQPERRLEDDEHKLNDEKLRGCQAFPPQAWHNPVHYGAAVKDCNYPLRTKFTLHSKKRRAGVTSVRVLPDTIHAVSGGEDGNAWVWNIKTGEPVSVFSHSEGKAIRAVAAFADAENVASGGDDDTINVWNWRTGFEKNGFQIPADASGVVPGDHPIDASILGLDNMAQWSTLAIASADGYFRVFDFRKGNVARLPRTAKSEQEIEEYWKAEWDLAANRDIGGLTGTEKLELEQTADSPQNPRENVPLGFGPPGEDKFGTKWGKAMSVSFVPINANTVVGYEYGTIVYWNTYTFEFISEFGPGKKAGPILALMAMQAAPYVFSGGMDGILRKFHIPSGKQVWEVDVGFGGAVRSLTIIPGTALVVVGSDDGYVRMYNGGTGDPYCQQDTGGSRVNAVTLNPGIQSQFITANQDGFARVFR